MNRKELRLTLMCMALAVPTFFLGRLLLGGIRLCSNLFFHGVASWLPADPTLSLSPWAIGVPALGGLIIGLVARYGSSAVRGHGIPEVIESVIQNESRVPLKVALLKPLCAAISIGSGGPFGAEGPVIGMGGSLGSLLGQWLPVSAWERKVLLSAGAAAGVTAVFGCPVAGTLLSLELLLYEFNPASLVAVGLAATMAAVLRVFMLGEAPIFPMPPLSEASASATVVYAMMGLPLGLAAVAITRLAHRSEQAFAKLPIHWMWWPALGGLAVGSIGYFAPRILGPSYQSIGDALDGSLAGQALLLFVAFKLAAWILALGSGTTGGTLAPLFGIGGGLGSLLCWGLNLAWPALALDPRLGALLGMAAVFAGASRALLASILIALETTHQFSSALPLFGCTLMATVTAHYLFPHGIMTEGLAHRGVHVPRSWDTPVH